MITDKIRKAGTLVRQANTSKRRSLAKKYGLTFSDFMPKNIRGTIKRHHIPESAVPANLIPSVSDPFPGVPMDAGESIPLSAIPAKQKRPVRREYDVQFKRDAVARLQTQPLAEIARDLNVAENLIRYWAKLYDPAWQFKAEMNREREVRVQRLEMAAVIVENEGRIDLGKRIRALARDRSKNNP